MRKKTLPDAETATLYQRLAAHFIDACIMIALMIAFVFLAAAVEGLSGSLAEGIRFVGAFAALFYRLLADGLMQGQSIGKRRMRIRVVGSSTGRSCAVWQSFVRALPIFIPFIGLVDVFLLLLNKHRRLGDFLARTEVLQGDPPPKPTRARGSRTRRAG